MAASIGLNSGLRALLSSRFVLDTIGHNIANANTPGYSRQNVDLAAGRPVFSRGSLIGSGVDARSVRRTVDTLLQRRLIGQTSTRARLASRYTGLTEIEALLREPEGSSLGARLDDFFASASGLSTNPTDGILRTGLVNSGIQLTSQFNQLSQSLGSIRRDTNREVAVRVNEVNELASAISSLNEEIASAKASGLTPNDLMDRRDLSIENLSKLVDVNTQMDATGSVRILVGGSTLVSTTRFHAMLVQDNTDGSVSVGIEGAAGSLGVTGGALGGLLAVAQGSAPDLQTDLDALARNLIRAVNRVHSRGIPASGPYTSLSSSNRLSDMDKDGDIRDELLSNSGLPFDIATGELFVNLTEEATGFVEKQGIAISRTHTTVGDFLDALSAVPHLSADLDALGRVQVFADVGYGFDFSTRLDTNPDQIGSFGGGEASLATPTAGPFALADGDTLLLDVGGTPIPITFTNADFADTSQATAEEIAAVIAGDPTAQANGIRAEAVDGRVVVQTAGAGSTLSFDLTGGTALAALGWSGLSGTTIAGHGTDVSVEVSGSYSGASNDVFTFVANQDGTIGTTPGLTVDVLDSSGRQVATLDVGAGYSPGAPIAVGNGVSVSFGLGELSATHNDVFSLDVIAESDSADVLVAVGLGGLFTGSGAEDIDLAEGIQLDHTLIASSTSGSAGDNGALLGLLDIERLTHTDLGSTTLGEFYGDVVGGVGFDLATTVDSLDATDTLIESLELRQEQVSGVNVDEELVDLLQFEQAFEAASRYISVLNELNDDLLSLL